MSSISRACTSGRGGILPTSSAQMIPQNERKPKSPGCSSFQSHCRARRLVRCLGKPRSVVCDSVESAVASRHKGIKEEWRTDALRPREAHTNYRALRAGTLSLSPRQHGTAPTVRLCGSAPQPSERRLRHDAAGSPVEQLAIRVPYRSCCRTWRQPHSRCRTLGT